MKNIADCFSEFGATIRNVRWGWSGRSDNGDVVVLTLWDDLIKVADGVPVFDSFRAGRVEDWSQRIGNRFRKLDIEHSLAVHGGQFRAVIQHAENPKAETRKVVDRHPDLERVWRVTDYNPDTGEFRAEAV